MSFLPLTRVKMDIVLNQTRSSLKTLNENTESILLGEILHFVIENLLICEKNNQNVFTTEGDFWREGLKFFRKGLALYSVPPSFRKKLEERGLEILKRLYKDRSFQTLVEELTKEAQVIYREVEGFIREKEHSPHFLFVRPDLIIKTKKGWILIEIKLHRSEIQTRELETQQIRRYLKLLQGIKPNVNIKTVLVYLEPFLIEEIRSHDLKGSDHPTQLSLFKDLK